MDGTARMIRDSAWRDATGPSAPLSNGEVAYAIEAMALEFSYQPIITLSGWACVGAEAVVRWAHPVRGLLAADVVTPLVERTPECLQRLGDAILRETLATCRQWRDDGRALGVWVKLPVSVLLQPGMPERAARLAREQRLPTDALTIEVPASTPRDDLPALADAAVRLRRERIRLSVGQYPAAAFGEHTIPEYPFSELKVAARRAGECTALATSHSRAAAAFADAKRRGLTTACRDVSQRAHWDLLEQLGCDIGQGDFIARPLPAEGFLKWARRWMPAAKS